MRFLHALAGAIVAGAVLGGVADVARATPITPTRDDEVIEVLPATSSGRRDDRQLRKRLAARPDDPVLATAVARSRVLPRWAAIVYAIGLAAWCPLFPPVFRVVDGLLIGVGGIALAWALRRPVPPPAAPGFHPEVPGTRPVAPEL